MASGRWRMLAGKAMMALAGALAIAATLSYWWGAVLSDSRSGSLIATSSGIVYTTIHRAAWHYGITSKASIVRLPSSSSSSQESYDPWKTDPASPQDPFPITIPGLLVVRTTPNPPFAGESQGYFCLIIMSAWAPPVLAGCLGVSLFVWGRRTRVRHLLAKRICIRCGYDLSKSPEGSPCSECGQPISLPPGGQRA